MILRKRRYFISKLKKIVQLILLFHVAFSLAIIVGKNKDKKLKKVESSFILLNEWMVLLENKKSIAERLTEYHYRNVAVYGLGVIGKHLIIQLKDTDIDISYVIDKSAISTGVKGISIYRPGETLPKVDAVIVTPIWEYKMIKDRMSEYVSCPIISLSEVIEGNRYV